MDKCVATQEVDDDGTPSVTQILYNYEFIDDFDQPQLGILGNCLLKSLLRRKPEDQDRDIPLVMFNHQSENGHHVSTSSITPTKHSSITPSVIWGPKVYDKENHTMTLMVRLRVATIYIATGYPEST